MCISSRSTDAAISVSVRRLRRPKTFHSFNTAVAGISSRIDGIFISSADSRVRTSLFAGYFLSIHLAAFQIVKSASVPLGWPLDDKCLLDSSWRCTFTPMERTMKKAIFLFPFLIGLGCGSGSQPAAATPQSGGRISVSPNSMLLHCIGTAPGQPPPQKIGPSPATMNYCRQLPGWDLYEQAGEHFKSGDHAGAAKIVISSAKAGNPIAQLRLAMLYEAGDGVPRDKKESFAWYLRAAQAGEPGAQSEVGGYYEEGDGVPENWPVAAQWYQQSASQGWMKGEFALGRCYEFGMGVPQNRQNAIYWFQKAGAQGMGQGAYFGRWLSDPTNNIGFRNDAEHNLVIAGKLRFGLGASDPAGITFVNSAQRNRWLTGLRNDVDRSEAQTFWNINKSEYDQCRSAGGNNCLPPGPEPGRH
jgi:Sel1 repeat